MVCRGPDLKPPPSPAPTEAATPPAAVDEGIPPLPRPLWVPNSPAPDPAPTQISPPPVTQVAPQEPVLKTQGFRWPWQAPESDSESDSESESVGIENVTNQSTDLPYTNRPLSPYTQFPELRPPSSPIPYPPREKV